MIAHDMPAEDYHAHPALSSSVVKRAAETTPAHVAAYMAGPQKASKALALGTVTHVAILEPHALEKRYFPATWPGRNTKAGKIAHEFVELHAMHEGKELIARSDFDAARRMRDAVHSHPEASIVLAHGRPEVSCFVTDPVTGCDLRSREDWAPADFDVIVDLKTCRDASAQWFGRDAFRLGYPVSAYHYKRCRQIETGVDCDFMWIAVESEPPHAVATYYAEDDVMQWAEQRWLTAVKALRRAAWLGDWHGHPRETQPLPMPHWAARELESQDMGLAL